MKRGRGRYAVPMLAAVAAVLAVAVASAAPTQNRAYPYPGQTDVSPGSSITYYFDQAMDKASVEGAFGVEPSVAGSFAWGSDDRMIAFRPDEPLAARTQVRVTIGTGARTARGGAVFTQPYVWSFTTSDDTAEVRFGYNAVPVQIVTPAGKRGVPIQVGYPRLTLDLALYPLDMAQFAVRYLAVPSGQSAIDLTGLTAASTWQAHVDASDSTPRLGLPEALAPGLYVLDARSPRVKAGQTFLVYTDYALVTKEGRDGILAWVARVPEGTVMPQATVRLHDAAGAELARADTDAEGLARFRLDGAEGLTRAALDGARFAVADVGGQRTVVGFDDNWYTSNYYYWWGRGGSWMAEQPELAGHMHTDRPIYRPGHTVHYKATLRRFTAEGFELPLPTTAVTVTVKDPTGNTVASRPDVTLDGYGSLSGDLPLGEDASVGQWSWEVVATSQTFSGSFQVQEYVKPDYEVTVETDAPFYVTGDQALVTVSADYYFGQPATDAEVTLRVFRGYYWWYERSGNQVGTYSGRTDQEGKWQVRVPVETDAGRSWPEDYFFEAEVVDASRRPVVSDTSVPVHGADFALTVTNQRYGVEAGQPVVVLAETRSHDDLPVAGRRIDFEVRQYRWTEGRGSWYEVISTQSQATDEAGVARVLFTRLAEGWYNIHVQTTDDHGRALQTETYAWIYSGSHPWYWRDGLEIDADRDAYAPGEVAHLLVRSPITTTALVTIERDDVYDEYVVPIAGATTIDVPIQADYAPNVVARVHLWEPLKDEYRQAEGQLITAEVNLSVPATDRRLAVEIVPDAATYEPGQEAAFTVRVRDAAGAPVRAQLSLAVVDKAVLALAQDTSGDIFDAFWGMRSDTVRTFDTLRPSQWYNYWMGDGAERGGPPQPAAPTGTAAPGNKEQEDEPQTAPRREFPDTAYWNATLETDDSGEVVVRMKMPDSLTTWKVLARAIALDARAGQGTAEVVVTKSIMADLALPRFAVQGDEFAVDVLGRNYVAGTLGGLCTLETAGLVQLDPGERSMSLPFNETRYSRWSVVAAALGTKPVTARLETDEGDDAIELPFEVQPFSVPERFARAGSTETEAVESFDVPYHAIPDGSSVEVRLAPGMAFGVLDGLEDLIGYPYGCVEQTMSRMLPNAVVGRLVRELGLEVPEIEAQLPDMMAVGLQKLYGFQNSNGSWGWWHWRYSEGGVYTTAYVLHGLTLTQAAGYDVDAGVLQRGFDWLAAALSAETDPRIAAYAVYVQSLAGRADPAVAVGLVDDMDTMDGFSLAALAIALDEVGRSDLADEALDKLEATAVRSMTTAYWPVEWDRERPWRYYYWYTMANSEKSTAMALDALALLRPESELAPMAARWLMENRWGAGWRTTQGTAFAVMALTDYLLTSGELDADYTWSVLLDGQELATGRVDRGNVVERIAPIEVGGDRLTPGTHELLLRKQGDGTLFYTVVGRLALYSDGFAAAKAEGLGIAMQRTYTGVAGRSGPDGWAVGDVVNVRLDVTTSEELHFVIIEDLLPAGFEGLNEALETETSKIPGSTMPWRWWGYERKEVRDDRVTFFASHLPPGTHVFEYAARAITPGTFSARPAEAYTMYRPEVWGRSASELVLVAADRIVDRPDLDGDFDRDCRLTEFDTNLVADGWTDGRRDVNGDGSTDAADLGTSNGRVGLQCGDGVPLPPGPAGDMALELRAPDELTQGEAFDVEVVLTGAGNVGAMEVTLDLPAGEFEVLGVSSGSLLAEARLLGPARSGDAVRVGAFALEGASLDGSSVVVVVRLRALVAGANQIDATRAVVSTDRGAAYTVTADGVDISPEPWVPRGVAYLPSLSRAR